MKQFLAILLCIPLLLTGCKTTGTTPPLAPGYTTSADQQMGQVLAGINAFYLTTQCETQGKNWSKGLGCVADQTITTPLILSPAEKTALNDLEISINVANVAYTTYHANPTTANQTAAQAAIPTTIR